MSEISFEAVTLAAARIGGWVRRTPVLTHPLDGGGEIVAKAEGLQITGSFKLRGATAKILTLPPHCRGVVAHSSGNHGAAVARAARRAGLGATIVMPGDAPTVKRELTAAEGARIVVVGRASSDRLARARQIATDEGLEIIEPYDDPIVACGQGTVALELLDDRAELDRFYAPVGGGGLMAGCAVVVAARCPNAEIIAVEPADADDTRQSLAAGTRVTVAPPRTIADGLRVQTPGEITFPVVERLVSRVETVTDDELLDTMRWAALHLRVVVEPSGAAALAVARREGVGRCGVILSGSNVEPDLWASLWGS